MIGCLPTQALAFLSVFVYTTHATQAIVFEWKPGFAVGILEKTGRQRKIKSLLEVVSSAENFRTDIRAQLTTCKMLVSGHTRRDFPGDSKAVPVTPRTHLLTPVVFPYS